MRRVTVPLENTPATSAPTTIPDELPNSWRGYDLLRERIVRGRSARQSESSNSRLAKARRRGKVSAAPQGQQIRPSLIGWTLLIIDHGRMIAPVTVMIATPPATFTVPVAVPLAPSN
jgi:hypothetical protein